MPLPDKETLGLWPTLEDLYAYREEVQDPDWFKKLFMNDPIPVSPTGRSRLEIPKRQSVDRAPRRDEEVTVVTVDYSKVERRIIAHYLSESGSLSA